MIWSGVLWILMWGGMFTSYYYVESPQFGSNLLISIQGIRAFSPILAVYFCLVWIFKERSRFPFLGVPLGFLFAYGLLGLVISVFLSPDPVEAAYWSGIFIAPFFVVWYVKGTMAPDRGFRLLIYLNDAIITVLTLMMLPSAWTIFRGRAGFSMVYDLPLGFGQVTRNGVGRYALVVVLFSALRFLSSHRSSRLIWIIPLVPSLVLLAQTQSRTALLGLVVMVFLYIWIRGLNWRFLFVGPVAAFVVWTSGLKWRAHGRWDALLYLSGRDSTWQKGLGQLERSPFLGWGFNADRILLNQEHMHNSYLQALIQTGVFGVLLFFAAFAGLGYLLYRKDFVRRIRDRQGERQVLSLESVLLVGFLFSRSFFESTAAFYGVDLLLLIPAFSYITHELIDATSEPQAGEKIPES